MVGSIDGWKVWKSTAINPINPASNKTAESVSKTEITFHWNHGLDAEFISGNEIGPPSPSSTEKQKKAQSNQLKPQNCTPSECQVSTGRDNVASEGSTSESDEEVRKTNKYLSEMYEEVSGPEGKIWPVTVSEALITRKRGRKRRHTAARSGRTVIEYNAKRDNEVMMADMLPSVVIARPKRKIKTGKMPLHKIKVVERPVLDMPLAKKKSFIARIRGSFSGALHDFKTSHAENPKSKNNFSLEMRSQTDIFSQLPQTTQYRQSQPGSRRCSNLTLNAPDKSRMSSFQQMELRDRLERIIQRENTYDTIASSNKISEEDTLGASSTVKTSNIKSKPSKPIKPAGPQPYGTIEKRAHVPKPIERPISIEDIELSTVYSLNPPLPPKIYDFTNIL